MQIIGSSQKAQYEALFNELLIRHFSNSDWNFNPEIYRKLVFDDFFLINFILEDKRITSYASMLVTNQKGIGDLIEGKVEEHQITPYPKGSEEPAYLFWMALVFEKRHQGPILFHSIFKELTALMKDWKFNVKKVFAIAYSPLSERLMRHHGFKRAGLYQGEYPIMAIDVMDNVWLKAFIPYIRVDSSPPWPGKVDDPVPEIDRAHKTEFDK